MTTPQHLWLRLHRREDLDTALPGLNLPDLLTLEPVSAHRRLRGPYTFGGELAARTVPDTWEAKPEVVRLHEVTLLTINPQLRNLVEPSKETLTSLAVPSERTRFYSRLRTLRLAHGMTAFLNERPQEAPACLVVRDADHADPCDAELLAVLLRRLDPAHIRMVVCTGYDELSEPVTEMPERLPEALKRFAERIDVDEPDRTGSDAAPSGAARRFVQLDGLTDDPRLLSAYEEADASTRAAWHDERADELADAEFNYRLGAVPYHREHGTDPHGAGVSALRFALDHCIDSGFYDATVDLGVRGRRYVTAQKEPAQWWAFTTKMTTSLAALARAAESEVLYNEARATSISPAVHQQAAYATAMLYTRHHEEDERDDTVAKGWINQAIAIASLDPNEASRAFHSAFYRNGLALIELHLGDPQRALELVEDGLHRLDNALDADVHALHRSVLRYNRAQVLAGLKRVEEALADYNTVIDLDPNYPEYHFDRAALLRRLGRDVEALADYDEAIRLSPPFPEAYFNRAVTRAGVGDVAGALADLAETTALDPTNVDAYINRAELLLESGDLVQVENDIAAGMELDPDRAELHVLAGHLQQLKDHSEEAMACYDKALDLQPDLVGALTARAELRYELSQPVEALADLDAAVDVEPDNAEVLFNRAVVSIDLGRTENALADLEHARGLAPDDTDIAEKLHECRRLVDSGAGS
ncbi:MAG TPA: tetratricopeptide repeat protein [Candidatus Stackebrandtia excrementipullorum]|nr:tetratricopeptide repeat protein [Candidatus Stackebrandtia excrementipullorum]